MKYIRSFWLEGLFGILILIVVLIGLQNSFASLDLFVYKNPKELPARESGLAVVPLEDYLEQAFAMEGCTVVITVKGGTGAYLAETISDSLKKAGFDQTDVLSWEECYTFLGIFSDGSVVYQYAGGEETAAFREYVGEHYMVVKSGKNTGIIYMNDVGYSVNERGWNIVVLDKKNNVIIDSVCFDTHEEGVPVYRLEGGKTVMVSERTVKNVAE